MALPSIRVKWEPSRGGNYHQNCVPYVSFSSETRCKYCFLEGTFMATAVRMKIYLIIFAWLAAAASVTQSADKLIDLTEADANTFRSQVGHTVILRGRLEDGKEGFALGGTPNDVWFYVLPEMPPSGVYSYPRTWTQFMHQQVQLTGELRFRSGGRSNGRDKAGRHIQVAPDCFYMVLQRTKIEPVKSKSK